MEDQKLYRRSGTQNGFGQEARDVSLLPQKQTRFTPDGRKVIWIEKKEFQIKSSVRPISILLYAYLPEHYKIETGSMRS